MKLLIKKDLKNLLPGFAMFVTGGIGIFLITVFAVKGSNENLAGTALRVFIYTLIAALVYTALKAAEVFRKNINDTAYLEKIKEGGIDRKSFLIYKLAEGFAMQFFLLSEYLVLFGIVKLVQGTKADVFAALLVYFEVLFFALALISLAFLAFSLNYSFFLRYKYALAASIMTGLTMFWVLWKIFDKTIPKSGRAAETGTIAYTLIVSVLLGIIYILLMDKKLEEKM